MQLLQRNWSYFSWKWGEFMNNGSVLQTLTWYPILAIGNWYWIQFEVTAKEVIPTTSTFKFGTPIAREPLAP